MPHPSCFTPGNDPVPILQEAGPVWTGAENVTPTGILSPNHPACSESVYRLLSSWPTKYMPTARGIPQAVTHLSTNHARGCLTWYGHWHYGPQRRLYVRIGKNPLGLILNFCNSKTKFSLWYQTVFMCMCTPPIILEPTTFKKNIKS